MCPEASKYRVYSFPRSGTGRERTSPLPPPRERTRYQVDGPTTLGERSKFEYPFSRRSLTLLRDRRRRPETRRDEEEYRKERMVMI